MIFPPGVLGPSFGLAQDKLTLRRVVVRRVFSSQYPILTLADTENGGFSD
jgi:hypothetical protein